MTGRELGESWNVDCLGFPEDSVKKQWFRECAWFTDSASLVSFGGDCFLFSPPSLCVMQYQIRALESQKRQQELVLRRKTQEVTALRRLAKPMSERVAGRVGRRPQPLDSGAEPSGSTASSELESSRSVSSIVRQWNTKLNGDLAEGDGPLAAARTIRSVPRLCLSIWALLDTTKILLLLLISLYC